MLDRKIEELKKKLILMGSITEDSLEKAISGLIEENGELLDKVLNKNEHQINKLEIEIDEFCTSLIALFQPEALYLRTILMALKINNDLERIGDLAVNIALSGKELIKKPKVKEFVDLPELANVVKKMQKLALDSFVNGSGEIAKQVLEMEKEADRLRDVIIEDLVGIMKKNPETVERSVELIRITRNLERIADLCTNICEDVIYIVEGKIIKHGSVKEIN